MIYPYSQTNRLEDPHEYMYTKFQGETFLEEYYSLRMDALQRCHIAESEQDNPDQRLINMALPVLEEMFGTHSSTARKKFLSFIEEGSDRYKPIFDDLDALATGLIEMTTTEAVKTLDLLHAVIASQLTGINAPGTKVWLDRLVQRFEVTKKIYAAYQVGFRKGTGENTSVRLYWLFALSLCLFYAQTHGLKYLNTLLKVCDLLCSLPDDMLQRHIPMFGLQAVLASELVSVVLLAENGGVCFASK